MCDFDDEPTDTVEYLKGEGLRIEREIEDEKDYAEKKRQYWISLIGKRIDASDGRGGRAIGTLLAVHDGTALPGKVWGYSGDAVALSLAVTPRTDVHYWPAGMCLPLDEIAMLPAETLRDYVA